GVGGRQHPNLVTGLLETADRLSHLPDRTAVQREVGGRDHRLVAEVDGLEAELCVIRERLARRARDGDSPALARRDAAELGDEPAPLVAVSDRIAGDEGGAGDNAIREERLAARREEVALVAPKREVREAVGAVLSDERLGTPAFVRLGRLG